MIRGPLTGSGDRAPQTRWASTSGKRRWRWRAVWTPRR